jgi:hypothetical protein
VLTVIRAVIALLCKAKLPWLPTAIIELPLLLLSGILAFKTLVARC